ncbi:MAG TPA: hypothetical protein V6C50_14415 [Crinalium sp.]
MADCIAQMSETLEDKGSRYDERHDRTAAHFFIITDLGWVV